MFPIGVHPLIQLPGRSVLRTPVEKRGIVTKILDVQEAIAGYSGTQEIMLAIERGELDGIAGYSWGVARAGNKDDLAAGRLKIVMQLGLEKHKTFPTCRCSTSS